MGWRDNLQEASFRKAKFFIDSHDYEFGRKNIFHDFPFRDDAELEDQGALVDTFSINAYILGNFSNQFDYFKERDKLIKALKEEGSGLLRHRYLGDKVVALQGSARMSERFNEGGIARFQLTFKEVPDEKKAGFSIDPVSFIDGLVADFNDISADVFAAIMDPLADLQKMSNSINSGMQSVIGKIRLLKSLPGSVISTATSIVLTATALADSVLSSPCDLANSVGGGFDSFLFAAGMLDDTVSRGILGGCSGRVENPEDANRNSDELTQEEGVALVTAAANMTTFGSELPTISVVSPASAADQANQQALINLTRLQGLLSAARIAVRTTYTSQEDANNLLLILTGLIDDYLDYLGEEAGDDTLANQGVAFNNDDIFKMVKELKPALKKSMDIIGANLANIVEYEVGTEVLSVLTLSYDRYEDLDRDKEIVERNATTILNPCFIPNGKTINILSE